MRSENKKLEKLRKNFTGKKEIMLESTTFATDV